MLARTPDAPEGVKGISLFIVPKFLVNDDGTLGARNDVHCVSIEHKLGIHASPTAVLAYGDKGGAVGYLVGEENRGLEYMFIMMNAARFAVGLRGRRASPSAPTSTRWPMRGARAGQAGRRLERRAASPIIHHPDVRRMLMTMKRADRGDARAGLRGRRRARHARTPSRRRRARKQHQAFVDLHDPAGQGLVAPRSSIEVASLGVQVHGGMGFIEETGAAQHLRDARITTIYEGTTGIQANDLVGRKTARDGGATAKALARAR